MAQRAGKTPIPPANRPGGISKTASGRSSKTTNPDIYAGSRAKEGNVWAERQTEVNNPIGRGGGKLRGDRQHMTPDPGMRGNATATKRGNRRNIGLRNDRNPQSVAGRRNNKVPNEGG